jgi:hypothetical protein
MRYGLLLLAAVASAQQTDPKGFVNEGLMRRSFSRIALKATEAPKPPVLFDAPMPAQCAIPLLEVPMNREVDSQMILPNSRGGTGGKMSLAPIPVCPKR